jgi:hypothetical protein
LADLRVTVVNTPATTVNNGTVGISNVNTVGTFGTNAAVSNWANQTAVQSFIQNIAR